jgi:hypothetical protein
MMLSVHAYAYTEKSEWTPSVAGKKVPFFQ